MDPYNCKDQYYQIIVYLNVHRMRRLSNEFMGASATVTGTGSICRGRRATGTSIRGPGIVGCRSLRQSGGL